MTSYPLEGITGHANDVSLALRIAGLESRVKAEARVAQARIEKLEARVERIAAALRREISSRTESNPSDSEDE